jgi:hypothetical protein
MRNFLDLTHSWNDRDLYLYNFVKKIDVNDLQTPHKNVGFFIDFI